MPPSDLDAHRRVEAARYALLRRLTLVMRHQMLVHIHPIGVLTESMEQHLSEPDPDLEQVGREMRQVQHFARAGVGASMDFVSWLAPEPGVRVPLAAAVAESVQLLQTHFALRGFKLHDGIGDMPQPVSRSALRALLPALLLALTDQAASPGDIRLSAHAGGDGLALEVEARSSRGAAGEAPAAAYRALGWDEIAVLADHEGLQLEHTPTRARLRWPSAS